MIAMYSLKVRLHQFSAGALLRPVSCFDLKQETIPPQVYFVPKLRISQSIIKSCLESHYLNMILKMSYHDIFPLVFLKARCLMQL